MIPKKKRNLLIITFVIILIVITVITLALLYINTDMFKSNETLFTKYISKNIDNTENFIKTFEKNEFEQSLEQNKYKTNTQVRVNYTENIGTTSETTQNSINKLKLNIDGQIDKINQYNYQDIQLYNSDNKILDLECIKENSNYGFRIQELFRQYLFAGNSIIKQLLIKAGVTEEQVAQLPENIDFEITQNPITFTEEEKQELTNKYLNSLKQNISKDKYSKQSNIDLIINGKRIKTNSYILKLTKEELNNRYINLLEMLKQDEIILGKIENIQQNLLQYNIIDKNINPRESFTSNISKKIDEIKAVNIGQDETTITVYESDGKTVSTSIETPEYKIDLDYLERDFMQITYSDNQDKNKFIKIENKENELNIEVNNQEEDVNKKYTISCNKTIENNKMKKTIIAKYEDGSNKVEANIEQNIEIVEKLDIKEDISEENIIMLNELEEEKSKQITNTVMALVTGKIDNLKSQIKANDLQKVLSTIGLINEVPNLEYEGITEVEKNRYNSKFELLQGEKVKKDNVLKMLETIKGDLISYDVVSNLELRLNLDRNNNNEEAADIIYNFIKEGTDRDYNIILEYDEQTGLAKDILLKVVQDKQ